MTQDSGIATHQDDAIGRFLESHPGSPVVLDLLGTLDPDQIRGRVNALDPAARDVFFFGASVGALFGIRRDDGSRVAMKIHTLFTDEAYFDEVQSLQAALADSGLPAPRPLGRKGLVLWEEWLDDGGFRDAHEPAVRAALARELARFHRVATASGLRPRRPFLGERQALWPKPHSVLFDFEATTDGAEWIDEIARATRDVPDAGVEVVGHSDWSTKHFRFDDELEITAIYDWDSVTTDREPALVGTAAGSFAYTQELDHPVDLWPTADESLAFVDEYEAERGHPFTDDERRSVLAACVYIRAYAARCQHAYGDNATASGLKEYALRLLGYTAE